MTTQKKAVIYALFAAVLYACNAPAAKLLLSRIPDVLLAGLLYLGAGTGVAIVFLPLRLTGHGKKEALLGKSDFPYILAMVLLDIAAAIALLHGLALTTAANASLLNHFEIAATALFAFFLFQEKISKRLWFAVILVSISGALLSFEDVCSFSFSSGSLFVLLAATFWGLENNCTRKLSEKDPLEIVMIKGLCSGAGSLLIGFFLGQHLPGVVFLLAALVVGFFTYGLSIYCYVWAQRFLGATKTSTYYAVSPFIGVILSLLIFREVPPPLFLAALLLMAAGTYFAVTDHS